MAARSINPLAPIHHHAHHRIAAAILDRSEDPNLGSNRREYIHAEVVAALDAASARSPTPEQNMATARRVVAEIMHFATLVPFGSSWQRHAESVVLVALNAAARGRR